MQRSVNDQFCDPPASYNRQVRVRRWQILEIELQRLLDGSVRLVEGLSDL
jgi:hypothetical protein